MLCVYGLIFFIAIVEVESKGSLQIDGFISGSNYIVKSATQQTLTCSYFGDKNVTISWNLCYNGSVFYPEVSVGDVSVSLIFVAKGSDQECICTSTTGTTGTLAAYIRVVIQSEATNDGDRASNEKNVLPIVLPSVLVPSLAMIGGVIAFMYKKLCKTVTQAVPAGPITHNISYNNCQVLNQLDGRNGPAIDVFGKKNQQAIQFGNQTNTPAIESSSDGPVITEIED